MPQAYYHNMATYDLFQLREAREAGCEDATLEDYVVYLQKTMKSSEMFAHLKRSAENEYPPVNQSEGG